MSVVVKSKLKEIAKYGGRRMNVSRDFAEILDQKIKGIIEEACRRAQSNNRSTVMGKDL